MEITIQISDDRIEDILNKEDGALSKEEIHDVFLKALTEYLSKNDGVIESIFTEPHLNYYGRSERVPTRTLTDIVKNIDINDETSEIRKCIVKTIETKMPEILAKMFSMAIMDQAFDRVARSGEIQEIIASTVNKMLSSNN